MKLLCSVRLFATPWTVARQAPLSMGFSRQEYWSGLPFPSPGDPPNPGIEPRSPELQADAVSSEPPGKQEDRLLCPWDSPGKNTGVDLLSLFQGIFPWTHISDVYLQRQVGFLPLMPPGKPFKEDTQCLTWHSVQFSSIAQSCPTLCDPMNRSMPGLPVHQPTPGVHSDSRPSSQ